MLGRAVVGAKLESMARFRIPCRRFASRFQPFLESGLEEKAKVRQISETLQGKSGSSMTGGYRAILEKSCLALARLRSHPLSNIQTRSGSGIGVRSL
jgi:hypothetical protein